MLKVETSNWDFGKIISVSNGINSFDILMGENGDLYFIPRVNKKELLNTENNRVSFIIDKEDYYLFEVFDKLHNEIINYRPFNSVQTNKFIKEDLDRKYPLVKNNIISWHSDETEEDNSSVLNIKKDNNKIILEFIKSKEDSVFITYGIRFSNSGSRYNPFNNRFMEAYRDLCEIDFKQITIEEYVRVLRKK